MLKTRLKIALLAVIVILTPKMLSAATVYETHADFLSRAFSGSPPEPAIVWLSGERKTSVRQLLGHDYAALRLRYWCRAQRTAWVLEEVGKDLPITVGVIVEKDHIKSLRVLTYRENRGGEVSTPAFTDQFSGVSLTSGNSLDQTIDGITGATLSVQALSRLAAVALYLHTDSGCGCDNE
ncbi:MAG: FMN-binding protein [Gammaproteobacteria bacterium]|nr:FMN-binding protein [Gammaproteobacteria bacterium]